MKSHLAIVGKSGNLALKPDASITVIEKNPMFNNVEMHSYPFELPFEQNRHLIKNMDDVNSTLRAQDVDGEPFAIIADGIRLRNTVMKVQEDAEIKNALSVNFDSNQKTLRGMIEDMNCQDVKIKDRLQIGEKIGNVNVSGKVTLNVTADISEGYWNPKDIHNWSFSAIFEPQALGFSYPGICELDTDGVSAKPSNNVKQKVYPRHTVNIPKVTKSFINVSEPYGSIINSPYKDENGIAIGWPFCNARVCYTHYDSKIENGIEETTDSVVQARKGSFSNEDYGPYWVLDANRPQSGICFYVLYFLDCLFYTLGLSFDKSELETIEDFKHLCFFTTKCCYDVSEDSDYEPITFSGRIREPGPGSDRPLTEEELKKPFETVNKWLESRGCGGTLIMGLEETKDLETYDNSPVVHGSTVYWKVGETTGGSSNVIESITAKASFVHYDWNTSVRILKMYANSKNFPDTTVTSVLDSLEKSFGIRFIYNEQTKSVKATIYRNLFRSSIKPVILHGTLLEMVPMTDKITGVRMCYSAEDDKKTQQGYVRNGVRDYETDYNYNDYPSDMLVLDKVYNQIFKNLSPNDMHVYVDLTTGNAFRVKINSEAVSADMLAPVMFEVGQFKGIEVGDCSLDNKDYVEEIISEFTPVAFSDVNYYKEMANSNSIQPVLSVYVDEKMEHEFIMQKLQSLFGMQYADVYLEQRLELIESYDPSQTESGNSPLQEIDWGMSIAMMRGGGTNMKVLNYDYNYDLMGNSKWKTLAGEYAMASDTMDQFGNEFDYNGELGGDGGGERFSLKIRAWKPFVYYIDADQQIHINYDVSLAGKAVDNGDSSDDNAYTWLIPCAADIYTDNQLTSRIRSRGLADALMCEYIHFLLNRKRYRAKMLCQAAQLADIPNHWYERFEIGGKIGWIDQFQYEVNEETGIGEVTIDFFVI